METAQARGCFFATAALAKQLRWALDRCDLEQLVEALFNRAAIFRGQYVHAEALNAERCGHGAVQHRAL